MPFDIGGTCKKAFGFCDNSAEMLENSKTYNYLSQANGALMRSAAIAVWSANMPIDKIIEYAKSDCRLSHPNEICQECNALYCIAIAHLLNNPGDADGAYNLALHNSVLTTKWFTEEIDDCMINIGHVKHAFKLAFDHLKNKTSYNDSIFYTLMRGGDTDTNAKIVGSMIGALHGIESIPKYMLTPVIEFDCVNYDNKKTLLGYNRPMRYGVKYVI
jgi:ADP-ribosylglycohydrolase